jgi:hypothetical protein
VHDELKKSKNQLATISKRQKHTQKTHTVMHKVMTLI